MAKHYSHCRYLHLTGMHNGDHFEKCMKSIPNRKGSKMNEIKSLLLKPCLRVDEAAILLDVTPRTVHKYLEDGRLTPVLDPAGRKRIRTEEILRFL